MASHLIWGIGVLGDLLVLWALFASRRVRWLPWFTLLIALHFSASVSLKIAAHMSGHEVTGLPVTLVDCADVLLQCALLAELLWIASRPLARIWRLTLPPLLLAGCGVILMSVAWAGDRSLRADLALMHFFLSLLMLEWAGLLGVLLRWLGLSWRSPIVAISIGYGAFAVVQLTVGSQHMASGGLSALLTNQLVRLSIYVLVVAWWLVSLWGPEPSVPWREAACSRTG
jgi:hypothetical protein